MRNGLIAALIAGSAILAACDDSPTGVNPVPVPILLTGPSEGVAHVKVFDPGTEAERQGFLGFPLTYTGGANVAAGDVNDDGHDDVIVGAATGLAHVRVVDGAAGVSGGEVGGDDLLAEFFAYSTQYTGGVNVAAGDFNGDGHDDIIVAAASGLAQIRVIDGAHAPTTTGEVGRAVVLADFLAFGTQYAGGVNVAVGDVNEDGTDDIIVGAASGLAHVRVIDGARVPTSGEVETTDLLADFLAFTTTYTGGVNVAAGDVNNDGAADVIAGAATGLAHVRVIDGATAPAGGEVDPAELLANFLAFTTTYTGGVNVAAGDVNNDGRSDVVAGAAAGAAHVRVISGALAPSGGEVGPADLLADFFAYPLSYTGGVEVAAGTVPPQG